LGKFWKKDKVGIRCGRLLITSNESGTVYSVFAHKIFDNLAIANEIKRHSITLVAVLDPNTFLDSFYK